MPRASQRAGTWHALPSSGFDNGKRGFLVDTFQVAASTRIAGPLFSIILTDPALRTPFVSAITNPVPDPTEKEIMRQVSNGSLDLLCCAVVGQPQRVDLHERHDWPDSAVINYDLLLARRFQGPLTLFCPAPNKTKGALPSQLFDLLAPLTVLPTVTNLPLRYCITLSAVFAFIHSTLCLRSLSLISGNDSASLGRLRLPQAQLETVRQAPD
ncbi:hypothetical protein SVAN01_11156 [Stagonosporopsis vannaccii]|nr:hypothetical protein SVAN01_11156 [Stagonosporopsis vannaccii]